MKKCNVNFKNCHGKKKKAMPLKIKMPSLNNQNAMLQKIKLSSEKIKKGFSELKNICDILNTKKYIIKGLVNPVALVSRARTGGRGFDPPPRLTNTRSPEVAAQQTTPAILHVVGSAPRIVRR